MAKSKKPKAQPDPPVPTQITASKDKFDPALASLFATSVSSQPLSVKAPMLTLPLSLGQ